MKNFKELAKNKVMTGRLAIGGAAALAPMAIGTVTSYAAEGDPGVMESVTTSLVTSVTGMATSIGTALGSIIPVAIPLVGIGLVVTIGLSVFKRVASKA